MAPGPAHTRILFFQISGLGKQWDSTGRNILAEAAALTGLKKGGVGEPPSEPLPRAQLLPHEAGLRPGSSPLRGALVARAAEAAGTRWRGGYSTWWPEGPKPPRLLWGADVSQGCQGGGSTAQGPEAGGPPSLGHQAQFRPGKPSRPCRAPPPRVLTFAWVVGMRSDAHVHEGLACCSPLAPP